jgi:uncharacterized protein (TIGR04255 family)
MKIDFLETFPHLPHAPIVEAIIDFRARSTTSCEQGQFETYFKKEFPDYPTIGVTSNTTYQFNAGTPNQSQASVSWHGLTFYSADKSRIAQCQKDGFSLSHLPPYPHWDKFSDEALVMWEKYKVLTKPMEIQRIGVRFINRIPITNAASKLDEYLIDAPKTWVSFPLPMAGFVHSDTFLIPSTNYVAHVIRALQPADAITNLPAIILDTDVSTLSPMPLNDQMLRTKLKEMRWLKNKIFFASLPPKLLHSFGI